MDAPIFVFLGIRDFSFSCAYFNLYTVNGKSLKIGATLDDFLKYVEHDP